MNRPYNTTVEKLCGQLPPGADCVKRPLIQCEAGDLEQAVSGLEVALERLSKRLEPALSHQEPVNAKFPCETPDCPLPALGEQIRNQRRRIERLKHQVEELEEKLEL